MNIIELDQNEISIISGGFPYTLALANIGTIFGAVIGVFDSIVTCEYYDWHPDHNCKEAFLAALEKVCDIYGIMRIVGLAGTIALGCAIGKFVGWCIENSLAWLGLINLGEKKASGA